MSGGRGMGVTVSDSGLMEVDTALCMHCGACVGTCPRNSIFLNEVIITFDETCNQCGLCVRVCPIGAIDKPEGSE
jgi:ferredoxin